MLRDEPCLDLKRATDVYIHTLTGSSVGGDDGQRRPPADVPIIHGHLDELLSLAHLLGLSGRTGRLSSRIEGRYEGHGDGGRWIPQQPYLLYHLAYLVAQYAQEAELRERYHAEAEDEEEVRRLPHPVKYRHLAALVVRLHAGERRFRRRRNVATVTRHVTDTRIIYTVHGLRRRTRRRRRGAAAAADWTAALGPVRPVVQRARNAAAGELALQLVPLLAEPRFLAVLHLQCAKSSFSLIYFIFSYIFQSLLHLLPEFRRSFER